MISNYNAFVILLEILFTQLKCVKMNCFYLRVDDADDTKIQLRTKGI